MSKRSFCHMVRSDSSRLYMLAGSMSHRLWYCSHTYSYMIEVRGASKVKNKAHK